VLLGLEGKRVDVDADRGDVGVVLVRLDQVEVGTLAARESVVAVELEETIDRGVVARHALNTRNGVARLQDGAVPVVRVVEGLLALVGANNRVVARHEGITLDNPDELLARVVEVELQLVGRRRDRLAARELENINQVLVRDLGELATLIRVQVDVVNVQGRRRKARLGDTVADGVGVRARGLVPAEVVERVELKVETNLVVLEGNQGKRQTRVAAEPELERNVERVLRRAAEELT